MKKRDVLSIIDSLEKINSSVTRNLEANVPVATEVLVDCQDAAIGVGNEIEKQGQEGEEIVHLLEAYCENIYQMNCVQADVNLCRKLTKKIQKQLVQIRNQVKYNLPDDKKQVVFLPYKASMWDSLESVWKAADADSNCDAYVIPIPYFDKNPDGSFREMHYEGDLYPEYVPVVSWEEYDIEAEHPDVIYIHNPYDECNHVTSVHPNFYSKNLRNCTDKLVYIPYFVLSEIEPDDQASINEIKHFCFMPGTIYANQVIVQSEKMREIYINEYIKAAKEIGLQGEHVDRKFLEKKFLGSGSPKFDKILNTKREDLKIPTEWLRIIEKPDGSWKKIVFYNTSVNALLQNDEKMLRKMESVFEIFKKNKDEVALLWRPHPLIQATIKSMRLQLWEEYQRCVKQYKEGGWGIYDDTADMDRAVVISDAYYGDYSSIVLLYQKMGKPIIVQDVDAFPVMGEVNGKNDIALNFKGYVRKENEIYFFNMEFNGLFRMSLDTYEITHIHTFSCADMNEFFCIGQYVMSYQDKMFFFLNNENLHKLYCYDLVKKEETILDFPCTEGTLMIYYYTFVWRNKGWIFPTDMSLGCYVIDLDNMRIERDGGMSELLAGYKWGMRVTKQDENGFFFVDMTKNEMVVVNVETKTKISFALPVQNVNGAVINRETVWMTLSDTSDVYEWNMEQNILIKYVLAEEDLWDKSDFPYANLIYVGEQDCVYLLGRSIGHILKTNREMRTIEIAFDFPKEFKFVKNKVQKYSFFSEVERVEDELWFYPVEGNMILVYSIGENVVRGIGCSVSIEDIPCAKEIILCELRKFVSEKYEGIYALQRVVDLLENGTNDLIIKM